MMNSCDEYNTSWVKCCYIAGPMRGIRHFNFPAFDAAKDEVLQLGFDPVSPADLDRDTGFDETAFPDDYDWIDLGKIGFNLHEALDRDIAALKNCQAIYMLDGWENSRGAKAEKALAEWLGLGVFYQTPPEVRSEDILEEALRLTKGDRQNQYGPPDQDFRRTAVMWEQLFQPFIEDGVLKLPPRAVAMAMIALKLSRETHQCKRDSWVDMAGYARCGWICAEQEVENQ